MKLLESMSQEQKGRVFQEWRAFINGLNPNQMGDQLKIELLSIVLKYAEANLNPRYLSLAASSRYDTCNSIFSARELPPIFFAYYVLKQLRAIPEANSSLRDSMLGMTRANYEILLVPYENQIKKIAGFFAMTFISLAFYQPAFAFQCIVLATILVGVFFAAPGLASMRVDNALKDRIARPYNMNQLGDGLDDLLSRMEITSLRIGTSSLALLTSGLERGLQLSTSSLALVSNGIDRGARLGTSSLALVSYGIERGTLIGASSLARISSGIERGLRFGASANRLFSSPSPAQRMVEVQGVGTNGEPTVVTDPVLADTSEADSVSAAELVQDDSARWVTHN